jgi:hypothetical protein
VGTDFAHAIDLWVTRQLMEPHGSWTRDALG